MEHIAHQGDLGSILLPKEIFRDRRLKPSGVLFLVTLIEFRNGQTGRTNPGGSAIEELSGISASNHARTIKHLVDLGWLKYVPGSHCHANEYTVCVPKEADYHFVYSRRTKARLPDAEWSDEVQRREKEISIFVRRRIRASADFWALSAEELILEMEQEAVDGFTWIPDEYLVNFGLVRSGDNSEAARELRREFSATAQSVSARPVASAHPSMKRYLVTATEKRLAMTRSLRVRVVVRTFCRSLRSRWSGLANVLRFWNRT